MRAVARLAARHAAGPRRGRGGGVAANAPLAVELSLVQHTPEPFRYPSYSTDNPHHEPQAEDPTRVQAQARLVQPGTFGSLVASDVSWSRLDYLVLRDEFPAAHVRLLHELFALYRASSAQHSGYYYAHASPGYGDQKYLDLSACESRQLWPVLEQAHAVAALRLPGRAGPVPPPARRSCAWTSRPRAPRCSSPR